MIWSASLVPIRRGHVYWLPDSAVILPPGLTKDRKLHPRRPFLVMSGDAHNTDESWPIVLGFPLSTAIEFTSEFDVQLKAGQAGLSQSCWVRIEMMQPMPKEKLRERVGQLEARVVEECMARLLGYLGEL